MIGAVTYIRVSTKEQTENLSLPTQLKACEEYCQRQGFEVLARFREEGRERQDHRSDRATETAAVLPPEQGQSPVRRRLQPDALRARTSTITSRCEHICKSLGISLRSATEPIDDTSTGKLMEGVLAAVRAVRQRRRSDRTRAGMQRSPGTRTLGVPRAARLRERASGDGQELDSRSGARAARAPCRPGFRDRTIYEA